MSELSTDDLYDLSMAMDVAVSPSGERVAFIADEFDPTEDERRSSLFIVPSDGSREPHRLTRASDAGMAKFSPDGTHLAFIGSRDTDVARTIGRDADDDEQDGDGDDDTADQKAATGDGEDGEAGDDAEGDDDGANGPDEEPKPQVWAFDLERGGDAIQLTDRDEGVREFDWGPDGDRIVISARDPTEDEQEEIDSRREGGPIEIERLQHKADGVGWTDEVTTYLFVVDIESGESERLDDAYGQGARAPLFGLQPSWAPGERIAFGSNRTDRPDDSGVTDLYTIDPDGENLRKITDSSRRTHGYEWGPDGERIAFVAGDPENWYKPTEIRVATDEAGDHWSVTGSLDRTVWLLADPTWDGDRILVGVGDEGLTRLVEADPAADDPKRTFPAQTRDRTLATVEVGGGQVATILSDPAAGRDVFALDSGDLDAERPETLTQLTDLNEELLDGVDLPETRRVEYENSDGETIESIVHLPSAFDPETDDPIPVIASIHGGPMAYDAPEFRFDYTYWTAQGYAVYRPNYRGSTSYGREFAESLMGSRGDLETDDVCSGLDALTERGWVDPDRSLVTGFSYGGITTANVVTRSDAFAVAAAEHGIYDFRSTFGTDDNHLWHEWEFGLPWEDPETFADISSITDVDEIETPLLVTAGEEDWRCPPTQAEQLYVSVRKQGVPAKLVIYQDEHHNVDDPDRAIHRIETLTEWFEEHALADDESE